MSVLDIYARYFDRSAGLPRISTEVLAAERVRIVGRDEVPDDARGSLLMLTSGFYPGPEAAHRGTTLGELSQFTVHGRPPPCASFPDSAAASVTIGELGVYSDPATGLEHHLAVGCTSDAEKEAMRKAVLVALAKIGNRELEALSQAFRERSARLPFARRLWIYTDVAFPHPTRPCRWAGVLEPSKTTAAALRFVLSIPSVTY